MNEDLSRAVVLFIQFGVARSPQENPDAVIAAFGKQGALVLLAKIHAILETMAAIPVDWKRETLDTASKRVRAEMKERYLELSDAALDALTWRFSFNWK